MKFRRHRSRAHDSRLARVAGAAPSLFLGLIGLTALAFIFYWVQHYVRRARAMPVNEEVRTRAPQHVPPPEAEVPPEAASGTPIQKKRDGEGMLYHRRYSAEITGAELTAEALMARMQADPNRFAPQLLARFEKNEGEEGRMEVGDEYFIHITGPWNGPVRVTEVTPTSFSFVTLEGHLEAGEIHFECLPHPERPNALRFEISSWARSRDRAVHLAYEVAGIARSAQTSMWANWCRCVVEESGGELVGEIEIVTEQREIVDEPSD